MKKLFEKRIEALNRKAQAAEKLVKVKNEQITELREEIGGKDELIQILSAYLCEAVCERGRVEIDSDKISKGLKVGYTIEVRGKNIILERRDSSLCSE